MTKSICEYGNVLIGSILTRIQDKSDDATEAEPLSLQELSYYCNQSDEEYIYKTLKINKNRYSNCLFSEVGDVVFGLTYGKAMVIEKDRSDKLVLSNFVVIRIKDKEVLDPYYLCWLINESNLVKRQLHKTSQGSGRVNLIPIAIIKSLEIITLPIEEQRLIGLIYDLSRRQKRIQRQKSDLLFKLTNYSLNEKIKRKG